MTDYSTWQPPEVMFASTDPDLVLMWRKLSHHTYRLGDIFELAADAIVSPANSFGFMDGGIDMVYTNKFGWGVQQQVQDDIRMNYGGELLVGQATSVILPKGHEYDYLIAAPTMRVPMVIDDPIDVYLSTRAAMREAIRLEVSSVLFPGMGTGTGRVKPSQAIPAMLRGIEDAIRQPHFPSTLGEAMMRHLSVCNA